MHVAEELQILVSLVYAAWDGHGPVVGVVTIVLWRGHERAVHRWSHFLNHRTVSAVELVKHLGDIALFARRHCSSFTIELCYAFRQVVLQSFLGAREHVRVDLEEAVEVALRLRVADQAGTL